MRISTIVLFIVICSICSCKKTVDGTVKGTLTEKGTGLPYSNVGIYIVRWEKHPFDGSANADNTVIDSTVTDASGKYSLSYLRKSKYRYSVFYRLKDFVTDNNFKEYTELTEKDFTKDFILFPTGYMKIYLQKTSSSTNHVELYFDDHFGPKFTLPNYNYPFDTILAPYKIIANTTLRFFNWYLLSDTPPYSVQHMDSIYVNKGDTLNYSINYN